MNKVTAKEATCLANLRLAQTAVSLAKFHFVHTNHYPESLVELVPHYLKTIPVDPFDGQELRYRRMGNGYVLYSIGPNRKGNGNRGKEQEGGIVFTINSAPGHL